MRLKLKHKDRVIEFDLEYRNRKTIGITIKPPNIIKVAVPFYITPDSAIETVKDKADWIIEKLDKYEDMDYKKVNKEFVDGELFMFLGKEYNLQIVQNDTIRRPTVELDEDILKVTSNVVTKEMLSKAIELWYRGQAKEIISQRVKYYQRYFAVLPSAIVVKEQKKRWGSCTSARRLLFNWRCAMMPQEVLDYIVVHEMCHMVQMNHSKEFWKLVEYILPNYKEKQSWLENNGWKLNL